MTQFAPRHLCEKLQAAGLVSYTWEGWKQEGVPAYTLLDLIGPSEQARANAVKWWGSHKETYDAGEYYNWIVRRLVITSDLNSDAEAWEYVERTGKAA